MCVCVCVCVWQQVAAAHREVPLEGFRSTVCGIATDLTGVGDVETMELVEPVGNRLREGRREGGRERGREGEREGGRERGREEERKAVRDAQRKTRYMTCVPHQRL